MIDIPQFVGVKQNPAYQLAYLVPCMKRIFILFFFLLFKAVSLAQCPQIYNSAGTLTNNPSFISCSGGAYNMNIQSNVAWGPYTINWGDGSPNSVGASYTALSLIPHTYAATTGTYQITVTIPGVACTTTAFVVMELPTNAVISIPPGLPTLGCAPKTLTFQNTSTNVSANTSFTYDFGDGSPIQIFNSTNAGALITHTYLKGTVNCQTQVNLFAKNYCNIVPSNSTWNPLQIYDLDDAMVTPDQVVKCYPDTTFIFTNSTNRNCVPQGNTFQRQEWWNFGNYWGVGHDSIFNWSPWPPTIPRTIAYPGLGTYNVMLRDSNLCGIDTAIISVSIVSPPSASLIVPGGNLCQNTSITFTNASPAGSSYLWNFGDGGGFVNLGNGNKNHTYTSPGTYTVQLIAFIAGGAACRDTASGVVTILAAPVANFTVNPNSGCNSILNATFTESSSLAVQWNWNFGNGNTSTLQVPPTQNYLTTGVFTASLTVTASTSCVHTRTASLIVRPKPVPAFAPISACVGAIANFTNTSTVTGTNPITSYTWNFGDASAISTQTNPAHTYTAPNTYSVKLIATTAFCIDSITQTVLVNLKPIANFVFSPTVACPPFAVSFSNTSVNNTSSFWSFGPSPTATSNLANPGYTYQNNSPAFLNYTVSLIVGTGAGCSDTISKPISVRPLPVADFTTTGFSGGCSPLPVTFSNSSTGATTYTWSFGDGVGSAATNPSHVYNNNSLLLVTHTITLVATNSVTCSDTIRKTIQIFPQPFTSFTMIPASGCTPLQVTFPSVPGVISYTWNFGDGSFPVVATTPTVHVFTNTTTANQTFTVKLIAQNGFGCIDSSNGYPLVFPRSYADFTASPLQGCTPFNVSFLNGSSGHATSNWTFGNGLNSNLPNPGTTYTNASGSPSQTFSIRLVVASVNNCKDSIEKTVLLYAQPKAGFALDTPACSPKVMTFTNTSTGATTYFWNLGDGSTSTFSNPVNLYSSSLDQYYPVRLKATNASGCSDSLTVNMLIHGKPTFEFDPSPDSGCTVLSVNFPSVVGVNSYFWDFGDGEASNTGNVTHLYTNNGVIDKNFNVVLIGKDKFGCADTSSKIIKVYPRPTAKFTAAPLSVYIPVQPVYFANLTSNGNFYKWDFGDDGTSEEFEPSHLYTKPGEYVITLIAENTRGCKDTFQLPETVKALDESSIIIPNAFTPNPSGSPGLIYDPNDLSNDIFHPDVRGAETYQLSIFSRWGELLFETTNPREGWDGYYKGVLCTQDVYVWKVKATFLDGKVLTKTGDVLLLR